jgi:putative hemolysin
MNQYIKIISGLMAVLICSTLASAMINPAATYCQALGYQYAVNHTPEGDIGSCQITADKTVDAWQFLEGKQAPEYSICNKTGYTLKVVSDSSKCEKLLTSQCAFCVREDGSEIEATDLMNLTFEETSCGDGKCRTSEDYQNCPQDCPSGGEDLYCDKVADGKCDPDCALLNETGDPDCNQSNQTNPTEKPTSCMPLLSLSLAGIAALLLKII